MNVTTPIPPDRSRHSQRGTIIVNVFGKTDVGRTREHNEDSFVVADLSTGNATLQPEVRQHVAGPRGSLFMVADGMGGAAAGEIASAMATEVVLEEMQRMWVEGVDRTPSAFAGALKHAAKAANTKINSYAVGHPEFRGMGTTATIAGLLNDTIYVAQIGDSRGYLIRDGVGIQITKDQSLMQKLVEAGELTEEEAEHSERRNIILQALGPEASIKVDLTHQPLRKGDTLVLCSDGLSTQINRDRITQIVSGEKDLTLVCKKLIDAANANGGPDNITVIVVRFEGEGLPEPSDDGDDEIGLVKHRVFPLDDSGSSSAVAPHENETTQPIPATPRTSENAIPTASATMEEPMAAVSSPAAAQPSLDSTIEEARPAPDTDSDFDDEDEEEDFDEDGPGVVRLVSIGVIALVILGAIWFAWTKFGPHAPK
jgi:serine/threonine protein phosphatase PrpC